MMHDEQGTLADGGRQVSVDGCAIGGFIAIILEEKLPLEVGSPWDWLQRPSPGDAA